MYCRFCGKEIENDSVFCVHCGKNVIVNSNSDSGKKSLSANEQTLTQNDQAVQDKGCFSCGTISILAVLGVILIVIIGIIASSKFSGMTRNLLSSDYTYTTSQDVASYSITITPKTNIDSCDIQLTLYDYKGDILFSDTISKTNLKEGNSYTYTFDFGFINSLTGSQVKYYISGKCGLFSGLFTNSSFIKPQSALIYHLN